WSKALWHLPVQDIIKNVDGPRGIFESAMPVETGGKMIQRAPNDPAWYRGGLYHDDMKLNVPGLWFMSWYDVSVGPNLALYNHVRKTASPDAANQQWAIIAPVAHCAYTRATADTIVGARSMGHARSERARRGQARRLHLRSDEPGAVVRGQRLLHRHGDSGRRVRPAADGSARGHPYIYVRRVQGRDRGERADRPDALRLIRREGYGLHRQGP